ncbi:hypothetical protein PC129_g5312 [Phytophthora cactorum]|uniref:Uncharacterized protein n=1 Tax=Phytophthora cactorum TaxID=29920 RepID=A0A8T1E1E9_9STRA|nr:hypothetical protein PC112_g7007 [Phytophthora cactorum]KAG2833650.1 hypothetical protein PC111_g6128 [Phytophthora cactorum]KAG2861480.1 hypothetical protein PC113_g7132 [Phytophthora cactorum]KAG2918898.1 hypothetical protein PC114_g6653 [Phytophthora cactorum]KAG2931553.1 hypothetical protein PC115_g6065 [Phytophthora cactorum]
MRLACTTASVLASEPRLLISIDNCIAETASTTESAMDGCGPPTWRLQEDGTCIFRVIQYQAWCSFPSTLVVAIGGI